MPEETQPATPVSPTGSPLLPPQVARWALLVVAVAAALTMAPDAGIALPPALLTGAKLAVLIGTMLGIASPGVRR